ncbi:MAG TPA: OmpA family protein [Candidatus Eisenbacteria bacterium]|nr:OmpA family protein [Candidatus Eisenbacteria bacterium]
MTGRVWIRGFVAGLVAFGVTSGAVVSVSGFPSVKDVKNKAGKALEKPKPTDEQKPAEGNAGQPESAQGSGKVSDVSTKFDFVPGDKVLFADDFTQDELGEFPARWKLLEGTWEVAEQSGERWLRCTSNNGHVRMKVSPTLPEFWTLEFDADKLDAAGNTLTLAAVTKDGATVWQAIFPYSGHNLWFDAGKISSDTPFGEPGGRHHFLFMARGTALKVYVDRDRMASVPDITEKGVPAEIDFGLGSPLKPMIANVRFAEGCKPPQDALDTGKLVTYGIRFATGSDVVMPESAPVLRQVSAYMTKHVDVRLKITGHTDNVGSTASNLDLSKRRAASVAKVLNEQFGIGADRFVTDGKGDSEPLAPNDKPEGKAMNRRVEFAKV